MKITIPAHKSIRVELFNEKAKYSKSYKAKLNYTSYNYKNEQFTSPDLIFTFTELNIPLLVPGSDIIVSKDSLPVMFNTTSGSNVKGRFKTDNLLDQSIKITDKVTKVTIENKEEKKLSKIMIERTWTEKVSRNVVIKNDSGQKVDSLILDVSEDPANHIIIYESETLKATKKQGPTLTFEFTLSIDEEISLTYDVLASKIEKINIASLKSNGKFDSDFFEDLNSENEAQSLNQE